MKRADFRLLDRLRVRWAEVDLQNIVFNGHYLMYFDTAMAAYWRALAMPYHETMHALQGDLYVRKATLEYLGSARYDEQLEVGMRCARIGNSSIVFEAAAFRGEACLVHGELVYVFADPATQRSQPVPPALRELLLGFEAGQTLVDVQRGDWTTLGAAARAIRQTVFVDEQQIPAELVCDAADEGAVHVVAFNRLGMAVAAGRAVDVGGGVIKVGRMATLPTVRGGGLASAVLAALMQAGRESGAQEVMLQAQASAVGFYRRLGYRLYGPVFEEAGIPHQEMRISL
ncbi:MAG: YbgC/FadM family acyl-CoA thioesterase [Rubrivivax sp.]|nr:YbgC/FadM family acyl-CoA thioesterase [Rubrivivax sp.]